MNSAGSRITNLSRIILSSTLVGSIALAGCTADDPTDETFYGPAVTPYLQQINVDKIFNKDNKSPKMLWEIKGTVAKSNDAGLVKRDRILVRHGEWLRLLDTSTNPPSELWSGVCQAYEYNDSHFACDTAAPYDPTHPEIKKAYDYELVSWLTGETDPNPQGLADLDLFEYSTGGGLIAAPKDDNLAEVAIYDTSSKEIIDSFKGRFVKTDPGLNYVIGSSGPELRIYQPNHAGPITINLNEGIERAENDKAQLIALQDGLLVMTTLADKRILARFYALDGSIVKEISGPPASMPKTDTETSIGKRYAFSGPRTLQNAIDAFEVIKGLEYTDTTSIMCSGVTEGVVCNNVNTSDHSLNGFPINKGSVTAADHSKAIAVTSDSAITFYKLKDDAPEEYGQIQIGKKPDVYAPNNSTLIIEQHIPASQISENDNDRPEDLRYGYSLGRMIRAYGEGLDS